MKSKAMLCVCAQLAMRVATHGVPGKSGWSQARPSFSFRAIKPSTNSVSAYFFRRSARVYLQNFPRRRCVAVLVRFW